MEDVTRADHCSSSDFTLIDCLPLAVSCNFRRQQTDFGKEHTLSTSCKVLDRPNLARTSACFVMKATRNHPKPALLPRLRLLPLSITCSVCESSATGICFQAPRESSCKLASILRTTKLSPTVLSFPNTATQHLLLLPCQPLPCPQALTTPTINFACEP